MFQTRKKGLSVQNIFLLILPLILICHNSWYSRLNDNNDCTTILVVTAFRPTVITNLLIDQQKSSKTYHQQPTSIFHQLNTNNENSILPNRWISTKQRPTTTLYDSSIQSSETTATTTTATGTYDDNSGSETDVNENTDLIYYEPKSQVLYDNYKYNYQLSINDNTYEQYWKEQANKYLDWSTSFHTVQHGTLTNGNIGWFLGGKLNIAYNTIDRHVFHYNRGTNVAIIWEGDEPDQIQHITYNELLQHVSRVSLALQRMGVQKGDVVTIYMPMTPEIVYTMLACTRIGAIHSVVFGGFSAEALSQRIVASQSKYIITAQYSKRSGKSIPLLDIVRTAQCIGTTNNIIQTIAVWDHPTCSTDDISKYKFNEKEIYMNDIVSKQRSYCPPVEMDSEDPLFILYTTGGYALWAAMTTQTTFQIKPSVSLNNKQNNNDIFACVADCGWITGHTYVVYGPLLNGCTTVLFESTPLYPNIGRYWDMIDRHRITHFYTSPTAIRSLMRYGNTIIQQYSLQTLKVLGTVGEPINPEAWMWYYKYIGKEQCTIVDTYWQTETGGHIITNIPGTIAMKPGSCTLPMYGIDVDIVDPVTGIIIEQEHVTDPSTTASSSTGQLYTHDISGVLVIRRPWPGMARTCLNDHERYMTTYLNQYNGYYFTGDACTRDKYGYYTIIGRVDDVINVSGHRIGTAEVESALVSHPAVSQAAVVSQPHPIKGESIVGFVTLQTNYIINDTTDESTLLIELRNQVRNDIGAFASPDLLYITDNMPMTRSGKIMRRILRKIITNDIGTIGDTSTLADPSVVTTLIEQVQSKTKK
jgi:acetyl-CoA synthetase